MKIFHSACFSFSSNYVFSLMLSIESFSVNRLGSWNEIEAKMKPQEGKKKTIWSIFRLAGI